MFKALICDHGIRAGDYCEVCVEKDISAELDRMHRRDCLVAIGKALRQRGTCDQDNSFALWKRLLYTWKVITCIIIRRRGGCKNRIEIALVYEGFESKAWQSLFVGPGWFREWFYDLEWDSSE